MSFAAWIIRETGLSLYDFRVLDRDGKSEAEVQEFFTKWLEEVKPNKILVNQAVMDAMDEGFDVTCKIINNLDN